MDLVHYLQQLGSDYQELIFDCSRMFYKESRQLVLELFVNYHPVDGGQPIDCETIRQHLHELSEGDEQLKNDWEKNALEITYLRHCIGDKNEGSPNFHTRLVLLYAQSISSLSASIQTLKSAKSGRILTCREMRGGGGEGGGQGGGLLEHAEWNVSDDHTARRAAVAEQEGIARVFGVVGSVRYHPDFGETERE